MEKQLNNRDRDFSIVDLSEYYGQNKEPSMSFVNPTQWINFIEGNYNDIKDTDFYFYSDHGLESALIALLFIRNGVQGFNLGKVPCSSDSKRSFLRSVKYCELYYDKKMETIIKRDFEYRDFLSKIKSTINFDSIELELYLKNQKNLVVDFGNSIRKAYRIKEFRMMNSQFENCSIEKIFNELTISNEGVHISSEELQFSVSLEDLWSKGRFIYGKFTYELRRELTATCKERLIQ